MAKLKVNELSLRGVSRGTDKAGYSTTVGERVLVFGDTHFSAIYTGSHIDYTDNCMKVMERILTLAEEANKEKGLAAVIFLGDVFGVKERNIHSTPLHMVLTSFFQRLNALSRNNVYSVRGNHDFGEHPDFNLYERLGFIKNPDYIDFNIGDETQLRFHIMNYGNEDKKIKLHPEGNIVLAHNDFSIPGVTDWHGGQGIDATMMYNLKGIDALISGHIHNPSKQAETFSIGDGSGDLINFFYPGCPTRVSERYDDCFYCVFDFEDGLVEFSAEPFGLWPASEEFHEKGTVDENEGIDPVDQMQHERLEEILEMLRTNQVFGGEITDQIKNIPGVPDRVKEKALETYQSVLG